MNLSTEPSIETLPEFYANIVDTNVINDQTIANYCSDTVRELNNLTEELQQTDLVEFGVRYNADHQINSFNGRFMECPSKSVHDDDDDDVIASVQSNDYRQSNAHVEHNYAISYQNNSANNDKLCTETVIGNLNCDVVDSSPFYTHFNKHLENNMDDNNDKLNRVSDEISQRDTYEYANGRASSECSRDDEYRVAMCMLQSVDLRGKNKIRKKNHVNNFIIKQFLFFFNRHVTTFIISNGCSVPVAWKY